jgi:hypothetical protein
MDIIKLFFTQEARNFGSLLSGFASILIAVFGIVGFWIWRVRRLKEKKQEVAADLILATVELVPCLKRLSSPVRLHPFEKEYKPSDGNQKRIDFKDVAECLVDENKKKIAKKNYAKYVEIEFERKVGFMERELEFYKKSNARAIIYFDDKIVNLAEEFWQIFINMRINHQAWVSYLSPENELCIDEINQSYDAVFRKETRNNIENISKQLIERLKSIARFK